MQKVESDNSMRGLDLENLQRSFGEGLGSALFSHAIGIRERGDSLLVEWGSRKDLARELAAVTPEKAWEAVLTDIDVRFRLLQERFNNTTFRPVVAQDVESPEVVTFGNY